MTRKLAGMLIVVSLWTVVIPLKIVLFKYLVNNVQALSMKDNKKSFKQDKLCMS